jgi:hypothetical protein
MQAASISRSLWRQLKRVRPSHDGSLELRPCRALLKEGRWVDRVYLVEEEAYLRHWQVHPEEDASRRALALEAIEEVAESPTRLPVRVADRLYRAGESGKGYAVFTLLLSNGRRLPYHTGHAVDFPQWPDDVTPDLVEDALPHEVPEEFRRRTPGPQEASAPHLWCLYRRSQPRWPRVVSAVWAILTWACAAWLVQRGRAFLAGAWPRLERTAPLDRLSSLGALETQAVITVLALALQAGLVAAPFVRRRSPLARLGILILMAPALALSAALTGAEQSGLAAAGTGGELALFLALWLVPVVNALLLVLPGRRSAPSPAAPGSGQAS